MAYLAPAGVKQSGNFTKAINTTASKTLSGVISDKVAGTPTFSFTPITTPNVVKTMTTATTQDGTSVSYRPVTGQMWPRNAPGVTTRTVVVQSNPTKATNTVYLYTTYGGF